MLSSIKLSYFLLIFVKILILSYGCWIKMEPDYELWPSFYCQRYYNTQSVIPLQKINEICYDPHSPDRNFLYKYRIVEWRGCVLYKLGALKLGKDPDDTLAFDADEHFYATLLKILNKPEQGTILSWWSYTSTLEMRNSVKKLIKDVSKCQHQFQLVQHLPSDRWYHFIHCVSHVFVTCQSGIRRTFAGITVWDKTPFQPS